MSDEEHRRFMLEALALADDAASVGEVPVGAIVVREGVVIGRGRNVREAKQDPTGHAEVLALQQAAEAVGSWRLEGCTLYATLEPCPMCAGAAMLGRVERVVYGCTDPKGGALGSLLDLSRIEGFNHHYDVVGGVLEDACREKLQSFFRALRSRRKEGWPSG